MNKISTRRVSNAFIIGLFVMISSVVLIGTVIWLGANKFFKENIYFVTYFEGSVEGLETGSAVKYQGVPVGSVAKIEVAPDGKLVQITMQIGSKIDLSDSIRVKSEFAGIAGGKFLQLHYPTEAAFYAMHPKLTFQPPYKVINSAPSGFEEIEIAAKEVMNNFRKFDVGGVSSGAIDMFNSTSEFMKNKQLYEIVKSLSEASLSLSHILANADSSSVIANANAISAKLLATSNKLFDFTETLNKKVEDIEINKRLDYAIMRYDSLISTIQHNINGVGFQSRTVLLTLNEALEQFKSTNKELRKSLRAISDNPSQIFLSEPPAKEK